MRPMLTTLGLLIGLSAISQNEYPQKYFRNPLDIPMSLAGNFGELRPNHYHMGVDLKTNQRQNLPVYAAAEGYVSRIKIEPAGFGRAIYITHPNGYTTVYGHLNNFAARIDDYVKQQQYAQETWKIQVEPPPDMFPVKKGEFIAFSGTTGGSQAPHVHFEIRRTADDVNLNPLLFGLPLVDKIRPKILKLAVYDRSRSIFEQTPRLFSVKGVTPSSYTTIPAIVKVGAPLVSLGVSAFDTHSGSANKLGIYEATVSMNDSDEESFTMDNISYNNTRNVNAHIDYRYKAMGGAYIQHLSELPGYLNSIYLNGPTHGVLDISDGDIYDIVIDVTDAAGNLAELKTMIQFDPTKAQPPAARGKMFYPLVMAGYQTENCEFFIGDKCLFDSVHIAYSDMGSGDPAVISDVHVIGSPTIPLQDTFLVRIRPILSMDSIDTSRVVMRCFAKNRSAVRKVQWQDDWATARFRDFGNFELVMDTVPPVIIPLNFTDGADLSKATRIVFDAKDNLRSLRRVRTELDGRWLRFTNDKNLSFIYSIDEKCPRGSHELKILAEDEAGNKTEKRYHFIR